MNTEILNQTENWLINLSSRTLAIKQHLEYDTKKERLKELTALIEQSAVWCDPKRAQTVGKEKKTIEVTVKLLDTITNHLADCKALLSMATAEADHETIMAVFHDVADIEKQLKQLESCTLFNQPMDANNCFIDIKAGAGGTEAQDWASMLFRMYIRYAERKGFQVEILEESEGEVAGITSATIKIAGRYAFGLLRTETGIHRLVRISPFDANAHRHTSFASAFVYPEIDESIQIDINPADLRIDTFRASGAGGQHVNKTDSAIRITHRPTGIVVQCQNDRSQHRNREEAMQLLRARLYDLALREQHKKKQALESNKKEVGWGHQIRSYVFDQSRIKDLRTGYEVGNIKSVMDGDLDGFIEASLMAKV
ncbi:MAG: peptide chain release factor 2 [Neisseriales bacterium]|nr:MAG: peptide chain release factor 2 [Neisseriales bacterium]